jgi:hypothetical protein
MKTIWHFDRTRRRLLQKAAAAAALGPLIVTDRTIAQTRTLYVNSWAGAIPPPRMPRSSSLSLRRQAYRSEP